MASARPPSPWWWSGHAGRTPSPLRYRVRWRLASCVNPRNYTRYRPAGKPKSMLSWHLAVVPHPLSPGGRGQGEGDKGMASGRLSLTPSLSHRVHADPYWGRGRDETPHTGRCGAAWPASGRGIGRTETCRMEEERSREPGGTGRRRPPGSSPARGRTGRRSRNARIETEGVILTHAPNLPGGPVRTRPHDGTVGYRWREGLRQSPTLRAARARCAATDVPGGRAFPPTRASLQLSCGGARGPSPPAPGNVIYGVGGRSRAANRPQASRRRSSPARGPRRLQGR